MFHAAYISPYIALLVLLIYSIGFTKHGDRMLTESEVILWIFVRD